MSTPSQVEAIFFTALEKPSALERSAYLDEACRGDPDLRHQVERLLAAHPRVGNFLEQPAMPQVTTAAGTQALEPAPPAGDARQQPPADPPTQTQAEPAPSDRNQHMAFLAPSGQPGSLGRLLHYEVQQIVGQGGFGTVLRAFDEKLHRVVAIKVLAPELAASGPARSRFLREARAAAAVRHQHVVDIHAVDEQPLPYLVMEYVAGKTLQDKIDQAGPLEVKEILRIGHQIARGLSAAHAQGLIHRDIKPANILLENGIEHVKLTDFGLARAADDASITQSGVVAGTPMYMSPEQAEGLTLDHRSDLFSLGTVLYAMCTGRPPFRATGTIAVLKRVCEDTPRPIREINAEIPQWLCDIVEKLHAKKPEDRYSSAQEVADLLARYLAEIQLHGGVLASPAASQPASGKSGHASPHPSARKWRRALVAATVLGLVLVAGAFLLLPGLGRYLSNQTALSLQTNSDDIKLVVSQDGKQVAVLSNSKSIQLPPGMYGFEIQAPGSMKIQGCTGSEYVWTGAWIGNLDLTSQVLEPIGLDEPAPSLPRLKGHNMVLSRGHQLVFVINGFPDGQADKLPLLARFGKDDAPLIKAVADDGGWRLDFDKAGNYKLFDVPITSPAPGKYVCQMEIKVANVEGSLDLDLFCDSVLESRSFNLPKTAEWAPAAEWCAFLRQEVQPKSLSVALDLKGPGTVWVRNVQLLHVKVAAPEQRAVVAAAGKIQVEPQGMKVLRGRQAWMDLSADGQTLAFADQVRLLSLWHLEGDQWQAGKTFPLASQPYRPAFSPDGSALLARRAFVKENGEWKQHAAWGPQTYIHAFAPDGKVVFVKEYPGDQLRAHRMPGGEQLKATEMKANEVVFQDQGQDYARAVRDGQLGIWRIEVQGREVFVNDNWPNTRGVAWTRDGKFLALGQPNGILTLWKKGPGGWQQHYTRKVAPSGMHGFALDVQERVLACFSPAGTCILCDLATGEELATLYGHDGMMLSAAFGPDGTLVTTAQDGHVGFWKVTLPQAPAQPFVVLARDKRIEARHATLADAVKAAQSGDTIEIRGDGPFVTGATDLGDKALAIRAGTGFRPVIEGNIPGQPHTNLLHTRGRLVLEGLDLSRTGEDKEGVYGILAARGPSLHLTNCRLLTNGPAGSPITVLPEVAECEIRNCLVVSRNWSAVKHSLRTKLVVENCVLASNTAPFFLDCGDFSGWGGTVQLKDNTCLASYFTEVRLQRPPPRNTEGKLAGTIAYSTHGNLFRSTPNKPVLALTVVAPPEQVSPEALVEFVRAGLSWQGRNDLFAADTAQVSLEWIVPEYKRQHMQVQEIPHLQKYLGMATTTAPDQVRFEGGHLHGKPHLLTPADFRLADGSAGKGKGEGGRDLGADVDLVGPGPAYEKWRMSKEYETWRKESDELLSRAASLFVILAKDQRAETWHATLADAVEAAQSGDTIEIRGDGPFVTEPINLADKALAIRAGTGFRPVVKLDSAALDRDVQLFRTRGLLILEGLELHTEATKRLTAHLVNGFGESSSVIVRHCRLVATGPSQQAFSLSWVPRVEIYNTEVISANASPLGWTFPSQATLVLDQSVVLGQSGLGVVIRQRSLKDARLVVRNSTVLGLDHVACGFSWRKSASATAGPKDQPGLQIEATSSILHGKFRLLGLETEDKSPEVPEELVAFLRTCRWKEGVNLLGPARPLVSDEGRPYPADKPALFPDDWKTFWNSDSIPGLVGEPRFAGGDVMSLKPEARPSLTAAAFRLADDSPGKGKGEGGKDLGADVDLVGPGEPYEKWRKSKEYETWRKQSDELLSRTASPFVILAKDNRAEAWHATLADAVNIAQSGDTIEIRGDGPFVSEPIEIVKKPLTFRAAAGFHPHLRLAPGVVDRHFLNAVSSPLVLEGLTLEVTGKVTNPGMAVVHSMWAPLHIAHCRVLATNGRALVSGNPGGSAWIQSCEVRSGLTGVELGHFSKGCVINNSLIIGDSYPLALSQFVTDMAELPLVLSNNTILGRRSHAIGYASYLPPQKLPADRPERKTPALRLQASGNVLDSRNVAFQHYPHDEALTLEEAASLLPRVVAFQDADNLYSCQNAILRVTREKTPQVLKFKTLAEWHEFWGIAQSTSQVGQPVYQGGDVWAKAIDNPTLLTPADFRLADGSPGKGAGKDGKDLGAAMDRVGPGKAYELWKQTPAYQEWREKAAE